MAGQPRKHHYIPQFYLAGFTRNGDSDGALYVVDTVKRTAWESNPKNAAHQRDFHEIQSDARTDPMIVEKHLSHIEGKWSSVLRTVLRERRLPTDDTFDDLIMFVAFQAVRVPLIRGKINTVLAEVKRKEEFARAWLEKQGHEVAVVSESESALFDQSSHVKQMIEMADELAPQLRRRRWRLWIADESAPDFICSDCPVVPTWTRTISGPYSPGFCTPSTLVTVPLSKRMAMVSMLECDVGERSATQSDVAKVNAASAMNAQQLYCSAFDFVWWIPAGSIGNKQDFLDLLSGESP